MHVSLSLVCWTWRSMPEAAAAMLDERGRSVRVVSMPCVEAFTEQAAD